MAIHILSTASPQVRQGPGFPRSTASTVLPGDMQNWPIWGAGFDTPSAQGVAVGAESCGRSVEEQ